jgi:hypothetical protein
MYDHSGNFNYHQLCAMADQIGVVHDDLDRMSGSVPVKELKRRLDVRIGQLNAQQQRPAEELRQREYQHKYAEFINLRSELEINGNHNLPPSSGFTPAALAMIDDHLAGLRKIKFRRGLPPVERKIAEICDVVNGLQDRVSALSDRVATLEATELQVLRTPTILDGKNGTESLL